MDTRLTEDGFFWMRDSVLSTEFCQDLITKFEECPDKKPGVTLSGPRPNHKISTDLMLTGHPEFCEEDRAIYTTLTMNARDYAGQLKHNPWKGNPNDTGYNMQRTLPGEYFAWHSDFYASIEKNMVRTCTFIFYLNDITEGGQTEFSNGVSVVPQTGRMLMFPADFSVCHRGVSPEKETKYIVTGWFHQAIDPKFTQ